MLRRAHPFGHRVHQDMEAYGLRDDVLLRLLEARAAVARHYVQSHADIDEAIVAPAVAPAAAPATTPSSSAPAANDDERPPSPPWKRRHRRERAAREASKREEPDSRGHRSANRNFSVKRFGLGRFTVARARLQCEVPWQTS
eukprot:1825164-Pleurochrysis_carterae.AAC.3